MTQKKIPLERTITIEIFMWLKKSGYWVVKIHGAAYQTSGLPDIIAIRDGVVLLAELKSEKGFVRPEQQKWLDNGAHLWRPSDRPRILELIA